MPLHDGPTNFQRLLPNALTGTRVAMAVVFFVVLTFWRWEDSAAQKLSMGISSRVDAWLLLAAGLFILAGLTDVADGYLARRWRVESSFGRIMDPFADKFLVVGAFVFLAGPDFWYEFREPNVVKLSGHGIQISGIYPWMAVVILARELLVTSIRGVLESQGIKFPADVFGKVKMALQSIAVPTSLIAPAVTNVLPSVGPGLHWWDNPWGRITIDLSAWVMMVATVLSGVPYVVRAVGLLMEQRRDRAAGRGD